MSDISDIDPEINETQTIELEITEDVKTDENVKLNGKSGDVNKPVLKKVSTARRLQRFLNASDKPPAMTLEYRNICARVPVSPGSKENKLILDHVSGVIKPGEFLALMGPSGAGKSTLLNTLGGRFDGEHSGDILINGKPRSKKIKKHLGYVLQMETLLPNLTVRETLEITAELRLPETMTKEKKKQRVDDIIHIMGLTSCENTMVQLASGGEKKRISVANEMLINPSILFLDEPTSGLDSTSAFNILTTLQELANQGRTVICAIHQPSSQMFSKFDKLLLLASAHVIYLGDASKATEYFGSIGYPCPIHYNPADFILEMVTDSFESEDELLKDKDKIKRLVIRSWKKVQQQGISYVSKTSSPVEAGDESQSDSEDDVEDGRKLVINGRAAHKKVASTSLLGHKQEEEFDVGSSSNKKWETSWLTQFKILYRRAFIHRRGNNISWLKATEILCTAIIAGLIWFQMDKTEANIQDWLGATFYIQIYLGFATMYRGVVYFPLERNVISKERQSGAYRLSSYYLSKALAEFPVDCFLPLIAVTIFFWMVGISLNFSTFMAYVAITMLGIFTSGAFGTLLGTAFMDLERAITGLAIFGLLMMLVGGFFVKSSEIPIYLKWVGYLSFMRYTYGSNVAIITSKVKFRCNKNGLSDYRECVDGSKYIKSGSIRDIYGLKSDLWLLLLVLLIQAIGWHILGYYALKKNTSISHTMPLTGKEIVKGIEIVNYDTDEDEEE